MNSYSVPMLELLRSDNIGNDHNGSHVPTFLVVDSKLVHDVLFAKYNQTFFYTKGGRNKKTKALIEER